MVGEKGLGRLGLDRLSKTTLVQTFTKNEGSGVELEIDWGKYEIASQSRLETIKHTLYKISKNGKTKGTTLRLLALKDNWTKEEFKLLHQDLSLLVSPFAGMNDF